jgi:hypothetical protein
MWPVRPRFIRSRRHIVLMLVVLVVPVLVLVGVYRVIRGGGQAPVAGVGVGVPAVDTTSGYRLARAANLFPVSEPSRLPPGWQSVSSAFQEGNAGAVLRIGFRGPGGGSVHIVESNVVATALVSGELGDDARIEDTVSLLGRDWQQYAADDRRALVLRQPERTTIVSGRVSVDELASLAAALG